MNLWRLFVLFPMAYIVWWFYSFAFWLIPALNVPIVNATLWDLISVGLYLTLGIAALVVSFILVFIFLVED